MFTVHEFTASDGHTLRYGKLTHPETPDTGRALLFVPGLGGSVKGALDFLQLLLPYYSPIYGPDLRGFGLNPLETPLFESRVILRDLTEFHEAVQLSTHASLTLCGISLGGVLATHLVTARPDLYERLILLAPAFRGHPKCFSTGYQVRNIAGRMLQGRRHRTYLPYGVEVLTRNAAILQDPHFTEAPPLALTIDFLLSVKALCAEARKKASRIQTPTLMVIPGQDKVCDPPAMREAFRCLPDSTPKLCLEYPDAFHDVLFEEEHRDIAEQIKNWAAHPPARHAREAFALHGATSAGFPAPSLQDRV